jgi:MoaA/NifB/PqqE/SkfB family radical SAM enzyme
MRSGMARASGGDPQQPCPPSGNHRADRNDHAGLAGISLIHAARRQKARPGMARSQGCLAGTGVCFIRTWGVSLRLPAGDGGVRRQTFADIWEIRIYMLRDTESLKGKCGYCEFRNVCMGCRARAFAATGDYMDEEPFCIYQPKTANPRSEEAHHVPVH